MVAKIKVLGADTVRRGFEKYGQAFVKGINAGLVLEGRAILNKSKQLVPVDTGNLRASGRMRTQRLGSFGQVRVIVGYGGPAAPYALIVHENPRSGKTGGRSPSGGKYKTWARVGQWKYLSTPFKERRPGMGRRIARKAVIVAKAARRR